MWVDCELVFLMLLLSRCGSGPRVMCDRGSVCVVLCSEFGPGPGRLWCLDDVHGWSDCVGNSRSLSCSVGGVVGFVS
jgi:hypothetical protein